MQEAQDNRMDVDGLVNLVKEHYGDYGLLDEYQNSIEAFARVAKNYKETYLTGDVDNFVEATMSMDAALGRVLVLSDILGMKPSQNLVNAILNEYANKAMVFASSRTGDVGLETEELRRLMETKTEGE